MRIPCVIGAALLLAGCAHDNYAGGDPALMASVLHDCKHAALRGSASAAPLAAGILGGAIGGALAGALSASSRPDPNQAIKACMAARGYAGTSEN